MSLNNDTTMLVTPAGGYNNGGNGMGWGGDWSSWIILFLIFGMFGWGGMGFGGMGGFGGGWGGMNGGIGSEVQRGFDHSSVIQKLDGLTQGLCDGFYAQNSALMNGFHGVDTAICGLGNTVQQGFNATNIAMMQGQNALQAQLAQCCCDNREAIAGVRYDMATQACATNNTIQNGIRDVIDNQNANSRAILDAMNANYIRTLESENTSLKLSASQANQNAVLMAAMDANKAEILRRSGHDCPTAAYIVQPPTPVAFNCGTGYAQGYGYGGNPCGVNC